MAAAFFAREAPAPLTGGAKKLTIFRMKLSEFFTTP
jgi:hypothetical protein